MKMTFVATPPAAPLRAAPVTVPLMARERRRFERRAYLLVLVLALVLTPFFVYGGYKLSFGLMLALVGIVLLLVAIALRPIVAFYAVAICVVLVEQEPLAFPDFTDQLNVFHWPPRLAGLVERPIGALFLYALLVLLIRNFATRRTLLEGGKIFGALLFLMGGVLWGVLHGLQVGGSFRLMVIEVRPFEYLFFAYVLAYNVVTTKRQIITFFWIVIVGAGIKAMQAMYIVYGVLHGTRGDLNEIMAHEDSFFWVALVLLAVLFLLQHRLRAQMRLAWLIVPFAVIAVYDNNRRADYVALMIGVAVAWIVVIAIRQTGSSRLKHIVGLAAIGVVAGAYILIFSHVQGALGAPARGVISTISPSASDARDVASNLYRQFENTDLLYTFHQSPLLGWGYGRDFLQPLVLPNILVNDPYYLLVPHNTILWVLMSLGVVGFVALWNFFGTLIIRGCQYARQMRDPYLQLVAIYIVGICFMEVILAYADYQLFFFRNVIYIGLLAAILMRLPMIDAEQTRREREKQERIERERQEREERERAVRAAQRVTVRMTGSPASFHVDGVPVP
ncbi:MAG TPA: O-antigen ligase family protein [Ktedonobacterales bacterium]